MTVKMYRTPRAVVTETYSDSSDDEEFSSQEEDPQLAHAVQDSDIQSVHTKENTSKRSHQADDDEDNNEQQSDENQEGESEEDKDEDLNEASEDDDQDEDEDGDDECDEDGDEDGDDTNSAWADSIAKILKTNKPKKKKTLVLSKAKKLNDPVKPKPKPAGFQVEKEDGVVTEEQIIPDENAEKSEVPEGPPRKKKRDIPSLRVKPNVLEKDRERLLSKIATKGVVQLFNAVKQQQKDIKNKLEEAGPLEVKRDKVLKNIDKRSFLDHLMGDKGKSINVDKEPVAQNKNSDNTTWNVLRDDFMMGSNKMKDWDKQLEDESEEGENQMEVEQEMESD